MNDEKVVRFVIRQLDASASATSQENLERLRLARQCALDRRAVRANARFAGVAGMFHLDLLTKRKLAYLAALLMLSLGVAYWHARSYIVELEEVDSAILTDEMPIDLITDKGFDAWLKSSDAR